MTCADAADFRRGLHQPGGRVPVGRAAAAGAGADHPVVPTSRRRTATHLRFEVVTNQCTGAPDYAGEQDDDPRANTDCTTASPQALNVRMAEFQAFAG